MEPLEQWEEEWLCFCAKYDQFGSEWQDMGLDEVFKAGWEARAKTATDEYLETLFQETRFGEEVNSSTKAKRKLLANALENQVEGYWSGRTLYRIMITGGFLIDTKSGEKKTLTLLGERFLEEERYDR